MEHNKQIKNTYGHMVTDYYVAVLREIYKERAKKLKSIKTRKDAEKYQEYVRSAIKKAFPLPETKTPLTPRITGVLEKPGYKIEKIIFESRKKFFVTGNLYIPNNLKREAPAVLVSCGHETKGKAYPLYQQVCIRLVKSGFVVFIYDPISQGERDQYYDTFDEQHPLRTNCCYAHNMLGKQLELVGDFFGAWRVWDGIRALDYLLSRSEVDHKKIGLTGCSGGGTLTTWLWALDDRFTFAAPSCFITTFLANMENELPSDNEQCPPGIIAAGLEQSDFFIAKAPKPVILLGQKYDFFDIRGFREAYSDIRRFYRIYRAEDNIRVFIGENLHGYSPDHQKEMVKFFCRYTGTKPYTEDVSYTVEQIENLWATRKGQVISEGSKPAYEIIAEISKEITRKKRDRSFQQISSTVKKILNISISKAVPYYRILRPFYSEKGDYVISRYAIETEKNISVILYKKARDTSKAFVLEPEKNISLYIPHISALQDIEEDPLALSLFSEGDIYSIDVRGIGVSMPDTPDDFLHPYGYNYLLKSYALMLGKPYLGQRIYDILSAFNLLKSKGVKEISLYGRGQGSIIALFIAILCKDIKKVVIKNYPPSFYEWTQVPSFLWPDANVPPSILKYIDIPELIKTLEGKIELIEPWGPDMGASQWKIKY
ncbi:MAG: acetylxylan esterase [bacterium]|nr:acetylxylan esterase [bacterium]